MAVRREYIADLYRNVLGREGSDQEISGWENAPDEQSVANMFYGSPEYTSQHGGNATWQDVGGVITPTNDNPVQTIGDDPNNYHGYDVNAPSQWQPSGAGSVNGSPYTGFNAKYDYSAFNTARLQDPGKSAKDAFAMLSNEAPPAPMGDKAQLNAWFKQYIQPGMEALGHHVISSGEDGFTFNNPEGTFYVDYAQNAGATPGSMLQRFQWNATPADAATAARYGGSGGGSGSTVNKLGQAYQSLGQYYGGPGGAGITNGPLQQVGQDPLSYLITGALANFIGSEGKTGFGNDVQAALTKIFSDGGDVPNDQVARRYESARELLDKGRRTMINDARGDLASRNLLSEPGIPQGAEIGAVSRITDRLAPEFSRALRDIYTDESAKADARQMTALQMATGFSTDQARNLLAGIGEGTARQSALADIALRSLQTNMAWSQFLAEFGLKREQVMYQIQNGNIDSIMPLLQAFIQMGGLSAGGYV